MKIRQILDKIDENQLFVPAFQREYVWKRADAKNLISSLIKDYPTGTMLTWETNNPPELKGTHKYTESQGAVKIILDGQQRITTLYMLMTGNIPPYYTEKEIENDIRSLYLNVETLDLEYFKKTFMENNPLWVNITDLFKGNVRDRDITDELEKRNNGERLPRDQESRISDNIIAVKRIEDRDFIEQIIPVKATIKGGDRYFLHCECQRRKSNRRGIGTCSNIRLLAPGSPAFQEQVATARKQRMGL